MVEFHEDVLCHILCRLPVKSIFRCRCVSKHWCTLTSSKSFIKKHLNNSVKTKTNQTLILYQHHLYSIYSMYSIGLYSLTDQAQELALPVNPSHNITKFIGSCNGLLCFSLLNENPGEVIMIWNPATRKSVKLPVIVVENPFTQDGIFSPENVDIVHGFGYDPVTDDYRVMMLVQFFEDGNHNVFRSEANVYSLSSKTWRKVQNFPNYRVCVKQLRSVLECGALHWFIMEERESEVDFESMVASFDLATEECRIFTQPDFADLGVMGLYLSKLEGCLSIVCNYFGLGVVHVWVMKEYGVTESWTKLFSVGSEIMRPSEHFMPLAYSESGDEVLLMINFEELYWYNLEKNTFKVVDVDVRGFPQPFNAVNCLESLVSLGDRAENDEKRGGENKRARAKREEKNQFLSVGFKLVL